MRPTTGPAPARGRGAARTCPYGKRRSGEDDPVIAEPLTTILTEDGVAVNRVASAEEGMRRLEAARPSAVVLDLTLPGLTGLVVLDRCKTDAQLAHCPSS